MPQHPETFGFLLDHDYLLVRQWVLGEIYVAELGNTEAIALRHSEDIRAWVTHNEAHRKMIERAKLANVKPEIRYLEFVDQLALVRRTLGREC